MEIKRSRIDDLEMDAETWVIRDFICPSLNLWSGEPKMGKSMLAGHAIHSLTNQVPFLNRPSDDRNHLIGWMGFDPGWKQELHQRWNGKLRNKLIMYDSIRDLNQTNWNLLASALNDDGITVFFIDHLYGLAGTTELNDANQVYKVFSLIRPIYEKFGIAVVLIHQAGKGYQNKGRAAHSVAIEGEARNLVRIYEKTRPNFRKVSLTSNQNGEEILKIALSDSVCEVRVADVLSKDRESERESPQRVSQFLGQANEIELSRGWKGAGRELFRLGFSTSADGGRKMAQIWGKQELLLRMEGGQIIAGPALSHWISNKDQNVA